MRIVPPSPTDLPPAAQNLLQLLYSVQDEDVILALTLIEGQELATEFIPELFILRRMHETAEVRYLANDLFVDYGSAAMHKFCEMEAPRMNSDANITAWLEDGIPAAADYSLERAARMAYHMYGYMGEICRRNGWLPEG